MIPQTLLVLDTTITHETVVIVGESLFRVGTPTPDGTPTLLRLGSVAHVLAIGEARVEALWQEAIRFVRMAKLYDPCKPATRLVWPEHGRSIQL